MGDEIIQIDEKRDKDNVDNEIVLHNPRDPHSAHNGKQVFLVSLSPKGTYVVTYSEDDKSIEGWIIKDSNLILDPEASVYKLPRSGYIRDIKVNDSKIVCFVNKMKEFVYHVEIFRMSNENQKFKLNPLPKRWWYDKMSNELSLVSSHELTSLAPYNKVIKEVLVDDDNIWVISPNYLFHWDLKTFQLKFSYSLGFTTTYKNENNEKFTVITKGNSIVVNYSNEIAIFLKEVHYPIRNIQLKGTNIKIEFCEVQNNVYLLAFDIPEKDETQNIILCIINDISKQPIDASIIFNDEDSENDSKNKFILYKYNSESKKAIRLINGKLEYINLLDLKLHEFFESYRDDDDLVGWNDYLGQTFKKYCYNDTLAFPDMENIRSLLSESSKYIKDLFSDEYENKNIATKDINFNNQKYKWRIELKNDELDEVDEPDELDELVKLDKLSVYSDKEEFLCSKDLGIKSKSLNWKILNNNALALNSYNEFMIIYEYDIYNKCIKTQYFIYKCEGLNIKDFAGPILPMTYAEDIKYIASLKEYFTILLESIISIIEDERCLAKYGPNLLSNLVKSADPELTRHIEDIYNKCIKLVKEDPKGNLKFLNIITSFMNDLYKKYPDYITKFNSEMFMILNPFNERIVNGEYSHFYAFSREVKISKITRYSKFFRFEYFQTLFYLFLPYLLDSLSAQNPNDPNNPWTLSNTYNQVDENGNILKETLIQVPSENTNLFYSYPTSLLATYLFLTGNQNSLSPWAPNPTTENTILFLLVAVFSFLIVIYLMNLFIGLLNIAIEEDNDRASYLVQKAEVIAEIELFYLLSHQKRWGTWFPEVM
ncbi:unnamed protein product [Rhizophagus irregularis]|nr:unnamed protein product [Rhizophagus irregularis]